MVKDFISCPRRVYYRINEPEIEPIQFPHFEVGLLVHEAIEKYSDNEEQAIAYVVDECFKRGFDNTNTLKATQMIKGYFKVIKSIDGDVIAREMPFNVKIRNINFTGRFDFVTSVAIYDWKTSSSVINSVTLDPQFIIYHEAAKRLFKGNKSIYYVSLKYQKLIKYEPDENVKETLFNEIIPPIIRAIKRKDLPPTGLFSYEQQCSRCVFKNACYNDLGIDKKEIVL